MKDLTKGFPAKVIILFAIPLMIGNIAQQLYNITDSKIVSLYVSSASLGAVGATAVISNLLIGFINGLTQGFAIVVAKHFGAKKMKNLRRTVFGIFVLTAIAAVLLTIVGILFVNPVLNLIGTPSDLITDSVSYLRIILFGMLFSSIYNMCANILRAVGDSKRPLYCLFISILVNIILDLTFVKLLNMGINGAAYATIIAQFICALMCLGILVFKAKELIPNPDEYDFTVPEYKELINFGLAMGLMGCIVNIGTIILQSAINGLGTIVVTAHIAARRVLDILMVMVYTIGFSMTTFVSQNYGAGRCDRIKQGIKHAVVMTSIITTILTIWTYLFGVDVVGWIASSRDEQILINGEMYLKIGVIFFYALGPLFIFRCSLQGMGAKSVPLITSTMELVIKILSVTFLVPRLGYLGVALTEPISWTIMMAFLLVGIVRTLKNVTFSQP